MPTRHCQGINYVVNKLQAHHFQQIYAASYIKEVGER